MQIIPKSVQDFIEFTVCAINGTDMSEEYLRTVDYDTLWEISKQQKMTSLISFVVHKYNDVIAESAGDNILNRFEQNRAFQIRKSILFDKEREEILSSLDNLGIWYAPLKGIVMQSIYPEYGMREMADNDILYDSQKAKDLIEMMELRGYIHKYSNSSCHDVFYKRPFYNFEFHRELFEAREKRIREYYIYPKRFLEKDDSSMNGFNLKKDDFYIYTVCHAYKHYIAGGGGIRNITDAYLLRKHYDLNYNYIDEQFKILGITEFEHRIRACGDKLFDNIFIILDEEERELLTELCLGYLYSEFGEKSIKRKLVFETTSTTIWGKKRNYIFNRLFPNSLFMEDMFPILKRIPILIPLTLPFVYGFRIIRGITRKPGRFLREIYLVVKNRV